MSGHASQVPKMSTNRYHESESNSKPMRPNASQSKTEVEQKPDSDCDLSNQEGADRLMAEVERLGRSSRNKVAETDIR